MSVLLRLIKYSWGHRWLLVGAYFTMIVATASALIVPYLLGTAIDEALQSGLKSNLLILAVVILVISILRGMFSYGQRYWTEELSQRAAFDIRNDFFKKLQSLSFGFHDQQQTGNLMSKATADVEAVRMFVSMGIIRSLSILVTVGLVAILMLSTNWKLGLITLAFVPLLVWRAVYMSTRLRPTWMAVQAETGTMTTLLQENLAGMKLVKSFGAGEFEENKFDVSSKKVTDLTYKATRLFASQGTLMTLIFSIATGAILWVGGREIIDGNMSPGDLAAFIMYMGILGMPVRISGWIVNTFSRAISAGQRIFDVLDAESPVQEAPRAITLGRIKGHVGFQRVYVRYEKTKDVIRDVNFQVDSGSVVALLGGPGSGKSTIAHVIPRFYDVSSGVVTIDGQDVRNVTLASLRKNVGIVLQDVFMFAASIRDNIGYGLDEVAMDEIIQAAKVAQIHDFIQDLPEGYNTWVGERGVTLSGGQRQRLAIARTLLLDPPILILDDSTSNVDMSTEHQIQKALSAVIKGRTTFVIAHRLSTVREADLILVLRDGRVVEAGSHSDLLKKSGSYHEIYNSQLMIEEADIPNDPISVSKEENS